MNSKTLPIFKLLVIISASASAQPANQPDSPPIQTSFRPSIAVVVGIFSILFSLTFLLLMYAKFCHSSGYEFFSHNPTARLTPSAHPNSSLRASSGIDKTVIESLPFFQFSSLKGSRDGLECAVCISWFDAAEVLRLLPGCRHAFHIGCVDRWLESHSTCPLCRCRVDPDDVNRFKCSSSSRFLLREEEEEDHGGLELGVFVEREGADGKNDDEGDGLVLHKFRHRIIVSDVVFKSRWSDIRSSDLVTLDCDMLSLMSSGRFAEKKGDLDDGFELENGVQLRSIISPGKRCMSEITDLSRFRVRKDRHLNLNGEEEVRKVWLPIARKTLRLFSGKHGKTEFGRQQIDVQICSNV